MKVFALIKRFLTGNARSLDALHTDQAMNFDAINSNMSSKFTKLNNAMDLHRNATNKVLELALEIKKSHQLLLEGNAVLAQRLEKIATALTLDKHTSSTQLSTLFDQMVDLKHIESSASKKLDIMMERVPATFKDQLKGLSHGVDSLRSTPPVINNATVVQSTPALVEARIYSSGERPGRGEEPFYSVDHFLTVNRKLLPRYLTASPGPAIVARLTELANDELIVVRLVRNSHRSNVRGYRSKDIIAAANHVAKVNGGLM